MKKALKIFQTLFWVVILAFLLLVVATFIPIKGNYKIFTVQSGSMEPTIHTGSIILVKAQKDYNIGDIVTRSTSDPKVTITHRIITKDEFGGFETKGDANEDQDGEILNSSNIIGKVFFTLPYVGYPIGYARTTPGFVILVIIPAVIIIYEELGKIKKEIMQAFARRKSKNEPMIGKVTFEEKIDFTRPSQNNATESQSRVKERRRMGL